MSDPYSSIPSTGKLKLKGVKDAKVSKKKKTTKKASVSADDVAGTGEDAAQPGEFEDRSVVLRQLEDEDKQIAKDDHRRIGVVDGERVEAGAGADGEDAVRPKTEAEMRYEEQRRKRVSP
jgi:FAM32A